MKFRKDFVTNSSSSSYVMAVCDDTTDKEIEEYVDNGIKKLIEDFPDIAKEREKYIEFVKNVIENPSISMNGVNIVCGTSYDDDISNIIADFPSTDKISAGVEYE